MRIPTLLAILIAVAMLVAPAATHAGDAFAAVPDHHAQMMASGDCKTAASGSGSEGKPTDGDKVAGMNCCISMCMAVAITPAAPFLAARLHDAAAPFSLTHQYHDCVAEIATPPPRLP